MAGLFLLNDLQVRHYYTGTAFDMRTMYSLIRAQLSIAAHLLLHVIRQPGQDAIVQVCDLTFRLAWPY